MAAVDARRSTVPNESGRLWVAIELGESCRCHWLATAERRARAPQRRSRCLLVLRAIDSAAEEEVAEGMIRSSMQQECLESWRWKEPSQ